jgi:poly-gamma-glutamate synthase PgsB/CapB
MLFLLVLVVLFVIYGVVEFRVHLRNLRRIPVRIQVNGTRGKSSVTRLIAAGLRASGLSVVAKTTGTTPRFITSDTEEEPITRPGKANIVENLKIVRRAAQLNPQVVVLECMALVPQNQWTDAHRLIQPTHGVITNARADHLDVMGPTVKDVAVALSNTVPAHGKFFTAEQEYFPIFARAAERQGSKAVQSHAETVTDEEMKGFTYIEHKENVALALSVCADLNVDRRTALRGMYRTRSDPGAMRVYTIHEQGKTIELVNTLAANDPDSINLLWQMTKNRKSERIVLVNCRADRADRSQQLAEMCARHFEADYYVASGDLTGMFVRQAIARGVPKEKVVDAGGKSEEKVYATVLGLVRQDAMVFATGNIVGYGAELIDYFAGKGAEIAY